MSGEPPRPTELIPSRLSFAWPPLLVCALGFGIGTLFGPPIVAAIARDGNESMVFVVAAGIGSLIAQFGVLPAWLVWGTGPFWKRLLVHWGLAIGLAIAWLFGLMLVVPSLGWPHHVARDLAIMGLCLPGFSLGIEAPLWTTRIFFGWRLRRPGAGDDCRPLAIRDFLAGMAVISVALAAARGANSLDEHGRNEVWIVQSIFSGFATLAGLLSLPPLAWCLLRIQDIPKGIVGVIAYTLAASYAVVALMAAFGGLPPDGTAIAAAFVFFGSFSATIAAAFGLARRAGYRLEVGRPARK